MIGMLNLAYEELDNPLYYILDDICSVMHCETPNHNVIRSAIMNCNYQVSYSHCAKNSIKTNAPSEVIWDILKRWVEGKPVKEKWMGPEYRVARIMKQPAQIEVDFSVRDDCMPNSKKNHMLRFQEPPPFWGPGSKPKRKADEEEEDALQNEKNKKTSEDSK